jgi:hypothetical protein
MRYLPAGKHFNRDEQSEFGMGCGGTGVGGVVVHDCAALGIGGAFGDHNKNVTYEPNFVD